MKALTTSLSENLKLTHIFEKGLKILRSNYQKTDW